MSTNTLPGRIRRSISGERQEGTLGLLFLAHLSSLDVLLGKLAAAGLGGLYALLAMIPLMFVAALVGGATGGELVRLSAVLGVCLCVSLACGLWASVSSRDPLLALAKGFGVFLALCLAPVVVNEIATTVWPPNSGCSLRGV